MTLWRGAHPLILASQSRARQKLLTNAGIAFEAIPAAIDERTIAKTSGLNNPGEIASLLALEKAVAVALAHPNRIIVGADQTLALGERMFDKPENRAQAAEQLRALSGNTHQLHAAIVVIDDGAVVDRKVSVARMTMRSLSDAAIENYLDAAGEAVMTSVGAYQLEGLGVHLFERVEGDHFTVLGLPLMMLLAVLRDRGCLEI